MFYQQLDMSHAFNSVLWSLQATVCQSHHSTDEKDQVEGKKQHCGQSRDAAV